MTRDPNRPVRSKRANRAIRPGGWLGPFVLVLFGVSALAVTTPATYARVTSGGPNTSPTSAFRHFSSSPSDSLKDEPVGIGLILSSPTEFADLSQAARRGAFLAVDRANRDGGFEGRKFRLLVRSLGAAWSSGTEKIVDLAYRPNVWGLVGGLTGRSAHLIEQIVTKRRIAFLTPWASRESLADIRLPWFFRLVPEDHDQARALTEWLPSQSSAPRLSTIRGAAPDHRLAEEAFVDVLSERGVSPTDRHSTEVDSELASLVDRIMDSEARHVALFLDRGRAAKLVSRLPPSSEPFHFFIPLSQASLSLACQLDTTEHEATFILPDPARREAAERFTRRYERRFNSRPSLPAWYTHDAVRTLVAAIRRAGLDRVQIQKALADLHLESGVTGPITFDDDGNRRSAHTTIVGRPSEGRSASSLSSWTGVPPCWTNASSQ